MPEKLFPYPKAMMQFPTLRQSLLSDFDNCALTTAMGLEYEGGWSTHEQGRGQLAHRTFAKCLTTMYEVAQDEDGGGYDDSDEPVLKGTIPVDVATAIFLETLRQDDVEPRDVVTVPLDQVKDLRWVVAKWARESAFDIDTLVDVEQRLHATLSYENPLGGRVERIVTGQLDALFITGDDLNHAIVIDWKDTWGLPGPQELGFDGYFQQRFYAYLVFRNYPSIQQVTLREQYVRFTEPREASLFRDDMENIEHELAALVERFDRAVEHGEPAHSNKARKARTALRKLARERDNAAGVGDMDLAVKLAAKYRDKRREYDNMVALWSPSPGHHCGFCPRPTACPIFPAVRGAGRIVTQEDAERVAGETVVADKAAAKGKAALKVWADRNGPIPVKDAKGERVWGHAPSTSTVKPSVDDIKREVELARVEGRAPNFDSLYKVRATTRFAMHQPKAKTDEAEEAELLAKLEASLAQAEARKKAA